MGGGVPGCHSMASAARALRRARYSESTAPGWLSLRWTVTSPSPERVTGAYSWASSNIAASGVSGRRTARRHSVAVDLGWRPAAAGPGWSSTQVYTLRQPPQAWGRKRRTDGFVGFRLEFQ